MRVEVGQAGCDEGRLEDATDRTGIAPWLAIQTDRLELARLSPIRIDASATAAIQSLPEPVAAAPPGARTWARLIARVYAVDPLRCRRSGGTLRLIAFIVERAAIVRILDHLDEPSRAPRMAPIRSPPCAGEWWDGDDIGDCRSLAFDPPVDVMPDDENQRQDVIG